MGQTRTPVHLGSLISRMGKGDQKALALFYESTCHVVYGLALRILADPAVAEEVALDVYMQVWQQATRYDASRGEPLAWLVTVARSRAIDRRRAGTLARISEQGLDAAGGYAAPDGNPEQLSSLAQRAACVRETLATLPPDQRKVLEMAYFGGFTHVEIAEKLSEPLGTIKSRIRLAMRKLHEVLGPLRGGA